MSATVWTHEGVGQNTYLKVPRVPEQIVKFPLFGFGTPASEVILAALCVVDHRGHLFPFLSITTEPLFAVTAITFHWSKCPSYKPLVDKLNA